MVHYKLGLQQKPLGLGQLLGRIALAQAIPHIATFLRSTVCLSVICHICALY